MYMHDGEVASSYVEVDSEKIRNKPYVTEHTFEGLSLTGNFYKFKVEVINEIGSVISLPIQLQLAAVPSKPSDVPV